MVEIEAGNEICRPQGLHGGGIGHQGEILHEQKSDPLGFSRVKRSHGPNLYHGVLFLKVCRRNGD
ncbi:hypothetical protein thsrh120_52510 [Rhizobium sp. No.120]